MTLAEVSPLTYVTPALIGAVSALAVAFVSDFFTRTRENRLRRQEAALKYRERQLGEFYGPLLSLIEQIQRVYDTKSALLKAASTNGLSPTDINRIDDYFWTTYFNPLHVGIRRLFRSKLYLLQDGQIPESFRVYFRHSVQEKAQKEIWRDLHIDTSFLKGVAYPRDLDTTVKKTIDAMMVDYRRELNAATNRG